MNGQRRESRRDLRGLYRALLEFPIILIVAFALVFGFVRPVVAAPFYVGSALRRERALRPR